jgi:L-iditol 2-dehydrogenase
MKAIRLNPAIPRYILGRALGRRFPSVLWNGLSCTQYVDVPEPSLPGDDWAKIKTKLGGICGTDLSTIRLHTSLSLTPFCSFPAIIGHEGVGSVSELGGGVRGFKLGDRVVVEPILWCAPRGIKQTCSYCQRGEVNLCQHWADGPLPAGMGIGACRDTGGTWSPMFVAHATQLYHVPHNVSDKNALMVEPFATALHAAINHYPADGELVVILGAGTIGLCLIAALKSLGCKARLVVLARHKFQAEAATRLGASSTVVGDDSTTLRDFAELAQAKIMRPMLGEPVLVGGADRVFECVGSESSIQNAVTITKSGGQIILVGVPNIIRLDWAPMIVKEITVRSSYAYHHAERLAASQQSTFDLALDLMSEGKVDLEWMLTHTFSLARYKQAFSLFARRGHRQVIKAAFEFD